MRAQIGPTVVLAFSNGKDSVHGDSVVWVKTRDGIRRTTPKRLEEELRWERTIAPNGQVFLRPLDEVSVATASSTAQREAVTKFRPIAYLMAHDVVDDLYEFELDGGRVIATTGDHGVMLAEKTQQGYVVREAAAKDVALGDRMLVAADLSTEAPENPLYEDWFLRLCGLWVADGCYALGRKIVISCGGDTRAVEFLRSIPRSRSMSEVASAALARERPKHATQSAALAAVVRVTGCSMPTAINVAYRKVARTHEFIKAKLLPKGDVWLCDARLTRRMMRLGFVGGSHTKRVPEWIFGLSRRQIGIFVAGYLDGDGCSVDGGFVATSVSRGLLVDIADLLQRLGAPCAIRTRTKRVGGFSRRLGSLTTLCATSHAAHAAFKRWCPTWKDIGARTQQPRDPYAFVSHGVRSIKRTQAARVYDFEVPGNGMFLANGVLVHNSVGSWIHLRRYFEDIRPVYREIIPGLEFVEESLTHYERFFGAKITRVPSEALMRNVERLSFMGWAEGTAVNDTPMFRGFTTIELNRVIYRTLKLEEDATWVANGLRRGDSMARALVLKSHGPVAEDLRQFSAVFDWTDVRLEQELIAAGCGLPIDYALFGRSFDSIRARFLRPIKEHLPEDYKRILRFFPLAEVELLRYEESLRSGGRITAEKLAQLRAEAGWRIPAETVTLPPEEG